MSSVTDMDGQTWYHCALCNGRPGTDEYNERGKWVKIEELSFLEPDEARGFPFGANICSDCAEREVRMGQEVDLVPEIYTIDISNLPRTDINGDPI